VKWLLGIGMIAMVGCAKPCDELAERVCTRAGLESEICSQTMERASSSSLEDHNTCGKVLKMGETLSKNR
jgi:hypothetical protein